MEKKTIGGFLAALRKANGMTQRDLAEQLHVSDKTVSRWERDDGAPELSLIPVLAEIFGITCDELLRGERSSPAERAAPPEEGAASARGEKQRQRLLKSSFARYQDLTCAAMGVSAVGLIAALIGDLAFLNAVLGFLLGAIFYVASLVAQAILVNRAFLGVEDAGLEEAALSDYKRRVIALAERSIGLTVVFLGFTLPLVLVDAHMGLTLGGLLLWGGLGAAVLLALYAVALFFCNAALLKRGVYALPDRELARWQHNRRLQKQCAAALAVLLPATLLFHVLGNELLWSADSLSAAHALTFSDYESFVAFMEQDIPYDPGYAPGSSIEAAVPVAPEQAEGYDEDDAALLTRTISDAEGNVVCTYIARNQNVTSIRYEAQKGTVLPIQVVTSGNYRAAAQQSAQITALYCLLYPAEVLAVLLVYAGKRERARG